MIGTAQGVEAGLQWRLDLSEYGVVGKWASGSLVILVLIDTLFKVVSLVKLKSEDKFGVDRYNGWAQSYNVT